MKEKSENLIGRAGLLMVVLAFAWPASAQTTINRASALAGNVTPGDAPGFPVTISRPGSYRLTGNLIVTNPDFDAVKVVADNLTLDLNGFMV
jgi:hypothetical protein